MAGHIKIDRKILNWEWYGDSKMVHLFLHLLIKANYTDSRFQGILIKRGQVIVGRLKLAAALGLSERQIRTCLDKLKLTGEIVVETTNKYSIITICKYDSYQSEKRKNDQQNDSQEVQQLTNNRPTTDQQPTTSKEELKKNKEEKEDMVGEKIFNTFPKSEHFNGLPDITLGSVKELIKITKQVSVTDEQVKGMWGVFKNQELTGEKFYKSEKDVYSHFTNWMKYQKFDIRSNEFINKEIKPIQPKINLK